MLGTNATATIHPRPLGPVEMAQVLAAVVALEADVAMLISLLAPRHTDGLIAELTRLATADGGSEELSPALRWLLPEIHEELGRYFRVLVV